MKKVRVILAIVALLFAFGGAIASRVFAPALTGYEFIPAQGEIPAQCVSRGMICSASGSWDCKVNTASPILRDSNTPSSQCGTALKRTSAPPAP